MKRNLLVIMFVLFLAPVSTIFSQQQEVSIYSQPDSPLQLSNVVPEWRNMLNNEGRQWNMLTVNFVSQNISDKAIKAYAIRIFGGEFDSDKGGTMFSYSPSKTTLLQPTQSRNESIGEYGYQEKTKSIKLAVDFVEFTDGSTWGKDMSDSAQLIAGIRAGTKAIQEYLLKINQQKGLEAVIKTLDEVIEIPSPEIQSENWKKGFQMGIRTTKNQFRGMYEKDGIKAVEAELNKPLN